MANARLFAALTGLAAMLVIALVSHGGGPAEPSSFLPASVVPAGVPPAAAGAPPVRVSTHQEMRAWLRFCRSADHAATAELRTAAFAAADPLVAGNALRALGRLEAVAPDHRLRALLQDPRPRVRQEAVVALGRSGDPAAVAAIAPLIAGDDPTLRSLAIEALGRLGGSAAQALLAQVATGPGSTTADRAFARAALHPAGTNDRRIASPR